jgi:hypothetical protein
MSMSTRPPARGLVPGPSSPGARRRTSATVRRCEVVEDGVGLTTAPWRTLCPQRVLELHDPDLSSLRQLPPGTSVALVTDRLFGRARMALRARLAGIEVQRSLVVLPSISSPLAVLDDNRSAVRHFWAVVAAVPPGVTWAHAPASLVLTAVRRLPWQLTGAIAPGRVLIGCRR